LNVNRFSVEAYPVEHRAPAWKDALAEFGLRSSLPLGTRLMQATLRGLATRRGSRILILTGDTQSLSWIDAIGSGDVWAALLIDGQGAAGDARGADSGDVVVGASNVILSLTGAFRLVLVGLSGELAEDRLRRRIGDGQVLDPTQSGTTLLSRLFLGLGDAPDMLPTALADSVEIAVVELLQGALVAQEATSAEGPADRRRSAFQRLAHRIEAHLHDPAYSIADLARAEGLSVRAVQKLFEVQNEAFGHYLRRHRLEGATRELIDPLHASALVAEIAYRWGFPDPAHFSRAFRKQYGVTPSAYREQIGTPPSAASQPLSRGRPAESLAVPRRRGAGGTASAMGARAMKPVPAAEDGVRHHLPVNAKTVHWGYFNRSREPVLTVRSGDVVTVETLTQHAMDDHARMVDGDPGAESVTSWTNERKNVDRRGAGPMDATTYGRGAGEGFGVHICTGPIAIEGASPGDVLEVEILDLQPRPSQAAGFQGKFFGSNCAVWWGYHYNDLLTEPRPREVITLFELEKAADGLFARCIYSFRWTAQRDPFGIMHPTFDYPGVPIDHETVAPNTNFLAGVRIPVRAHFGIIAVAPDVDGFLDTTPPSSFGGNIDNWRLGAGSRVFLPVAVPGALLSVGDPHAAQGDGEVSGTAIECSLTGTIRLHLHRRNTTRAMLRDLTYPLIETPDAWIMQGFSHPNYLAELGSAAQSEVYKKSSLDAAMRDAFRKARRFLMAGFGLSEDEAIALMSVGADFGVTQVVNGNLGVHAIIRKCILPARRQG
jgi:acetamidase/formamidase/AraC-like DNA-binding protein